MEITQIKRKSNHHNSVDKMLDAINPLMASKINLKELTCPYQNNGVINKIKNLFWVLTLKDKNIHITGDVTYLALFLFNKNIIITILDMGMFHRKKTLKNLFFNFLWYKIPIIKSKQIIAISDKTKNEIINYYPFSKNKVKTIHVPLSQGYYYKKLNNNKLFKIIQVATSYHNKNVNRSIRALDGLPVEYILVGVISENDKKLLQNLKIKHRLFFNISEDLIIQLYEESDILLFPSLYEGFGMPIIEAQATSCCVITSNIQPLIEVGGEGAIYVNPYNVDEISKAISLLIDSKKIFLQMIEKGYQNVERFYPKKISIEYLKIYECLKEF